MKILRLGALPQKKVYEATCSHCKTHFSFLQEEAKSNTSKYGERVLNVVCPMLDCNVVAYVSA